MFFKSLVMTGLATVASAHIVITNPVPYGKSSLTNGPLAADGSDFPCKQRDGVYDLQGASNVYKQGSTQQLAFMGSAVHGGGSCQVSITSDLEPTKDSVWKVIKSIEGGCPAKDQTGNMGDNANAEVPYKYDYTIPDELASGNYTVAWTWFNKIGNREMYMNCAPLTVTGDGGDDGFMDTLPDMFTANIGNSCGTQDASDLVFPNPGSDVDKFNGNTDVFSSATGPGCQATGGSGGGNGGGNSAAPTTAAGSSPTVSQGNGGAPATTSAPGSDASGAPGGVFITVSQSQPAASQPAVSEPATSAAPVGSTPVASSGTPAQTTSAPEPGSDNGSGSGSPSGGFAAGTACDSEGEWNCIGGSSFQRCASGAWSTVQSLAAGVSCTEGQSSELQMASKRGKKVMRRAMRLRA